MASKKKAAETTPAATTTVKEKAVKTAKTASKSVTKPAEKQPEEKTPAAKKAACKTSVCVELDGLSVSISDIQNAVKKAVKEKGLEASDLKIYINAAEQAAYYTVDGEGGEDSRVDLRTL